MCRASRFPRATSATCTAAMPRPLDAVLEHNRLDLLSLALVTARAAQLLDEGAPGTQDGTRSARAGSSVRARRNDARREGLLCPRRRYWQRRRPAFAPKPFGRLPYSRGGCGRYRGCRGRVASPARPAMPVRSRSSAKRQRRSPFTSSTAFAIRCRRAGLRCGRCRSTTARATAGY